MHGEMAAMDMALLPTWLRVAWVVALCGVVVVHVGHMAAMPGQRRAWHAGHTFMAAGMALMYLLPHTHYPGLHRFALVLFALVTIIEAGATGMFRVRERKLNPLWLLATADMAVMTYMLVSPAARPSWLNWVFLAYLGCQTLAWAFGVWDRLPLFRHRTTAATFASRGQPEPTSGQHAPTPLAAQPAPESVTGPVTGLTAHSTVTVRATLMITTASMAHMLAVM